MGKYSAPKDVYHVYFYSEMSMREVILPDVTREEAEDFAFNNAHWYEDYNVMREY